MRVYITGIYGMLGTALAHMHRKRGDEVFGCDVWKILPPDYAHINVMDYDSLLEHMKAVKPDRVYHCAAVLGVYNTEKNPALTAQVNTTGTYNTVSSAYVSGASEFVFLSSSEVYGHGYDFKPFSEDSPLLGDNVYAISKKKAEDYVLHNPREMKVIVARMFNCYGFNQVKQFLIPKAVDYALRGQPMPLYGNPSNMRSYLFGHDAADHLLAVADNAPSGTIVNVAHPTAYKLSEVVEEIGRQLKREFSYVLRRASYDDRTVSRDVPNRFAVTDVLRKYSDHKPMELSAGIYLVANAPQYLRDDWDYERNAG